MNPYELDDVLADQEWLRCLALALAGNLHDADDLIQEGWLATLEKPPRAAGAWRSWVRVVLERSHLLAHRRGLRRHRREERAARPEPQESTAALVERLEVSHAVVDAVRRLTPEGREVILRRYHSGEKPGEIARALGIPVNTVRTRIARARERIREDLEGRFGRDVELRFVLSPLLGPALRRSALPIHLGIGGIAIMAKKIVITGVLVLLAWFAWRGLTGEPGSGSTRNESASTASTSKRSSDDALPDDASSPPMKSVASPGGVPAGATSTPTGGGAESRRIVVRLQCFDGEGAAFNFARAELKLFGKGWGSADIVTERSPFEAEVAADAAWVEVSQLWIDGVAARASSRQYPIDGEGVVEIEAELLPVSEIRVLDGATGDPLDRVFVTAGERHPGIDPPSPELSDLVIDDEPSPVHYNHHTPVVWVGSPGYAWAPMRFERGRREPLEVRLRAAGAIDVHTTSEGAIVSIIPVLNDEAALVDAVYWSRPQDGRVNVSSLEPGLYEVWLGPHPQRLDEENKVAERRVQVRAGEIVEVEIEPDPGGAFVEVPFRFRYSLEPAIVGLRVTLQPWSRRGVSPSAYVRAVEVDGKSEIAGALRVPPGDYVLEIGRLQYRERVRIDDAPAPLERDLSPDGLAEVEVRVVEDGNGRDVPEAGVTYTRWEPEGLRSYSGVSVSRDQDGALRLWTLPGTVEFDVVADRWSGRETVEVESGSQRIDLVVRPTLGIAMVFLDGDVRVAIPEVRWSPRVSRVPDGLEPTSESRRANTITIRVAEPGLYLIDFTGLEFPGYRLPDPLEVDVPAGEWIELQVPLTR